MDCIRNIEKENPIQKTPTIECSLRLEQINKNNIISTLTRNNDHQYYLLSTIHSINFTIFIFNNDDENVQVDEKERVVETDHNRLKGLFIYLFM